MMVQESQDKARYLGAASAYLKGPHWKKKKVRALVWPALE